MKWEQELWYELWDRLAARAWTPGTTRAAPGARSKPRRLMRVARPTPTPKGYEPPSPQQTDRRDASRDPMHRGVPCRSEVAFRRRVGVLAGLLLSAAVSALVGASAALLCAVAGAWLVLTMIFGPRNVLDAGCFFMLLVVGVVVNPATNGPGPLIP